LICIKACYARVCFEGPAVLGEAWHVSTHRELCTDGCDSCQTIVVRTYREMRKCGTADRPAFRAAMRVLSLRHPERSAKEVKTMASKWVADALRCES
jgi:hypothetical protein